MCPKGGSIFYGLLDNETYLFKHLLFYVYVVNRQFQGGEYTF